MADKTRTSRTQNDQPDGEKKIVTIKKYANRRLYNTATSSYVTLDHLCQMVKDDVDFVVYDAKTGEDITRAVLTQIIVEEEGKGQNLLPIGFLRQLIGFYGDNLQMVVPRYLETAMSTFTDNQDNMRSYMKEAFGGLFPFTQFEDMTKKNLVMFEQAMKMFTPPIGGDTKPAPTASEPPKAASSPDHQTAAAVRTLHDQFEQLRHQLEKLGETKGKG
jgi:polyhydroxyalkanoate synthesis repressor PhaR